MDEEALAQDETGINGITLELNGDLRPPGDNLEALSGGHVLSDHVGHQVLPIEDGQHVSVADVQTAKGENNTDKQDFRERFCFFIWWAFCSAITGCVPYLTEAKK